ncbi:hypothetical protein BO71DRAFT_359062 [Aspergillus ellipticus CBS 707.79]|uniref:Zn(2)-C6 fungal-type domain-containing protein n=1 Tax=Aspergillus ellipticus CBS 707.79 TaxID=1448320 RepID=A0A319D377_9EURO|nr:hypothetical protein BO71DRAFT_359062 [Aspergillus ellipticus CBS 707.79]
MVYRGKPSLGCALCRKRRLTCDQRRPSCSQCLRVNQECSGYRDPGTLRICNQTTEVAVKAQGQRKSISPAKQPPPTTAPILPPPTSIDQRALSYIFTYYVGTIQNQGILSYLPDILNSTPSSALQATIRAVGLASLSKVPELRRSAAEEYGIALRATNEALRDPVSVKSDSTLGAVVLLSFYELITCNASDLMNKWKNHIQGATKLLELRGEEQLSSHIGLELFTTVRLQHVISSIFFRISTHDTQRLASLSQLARTKRDEHTQHIETFYSILLQLSTLSIKVDNAHRNPDPIKNLSSLITQSLHIDTALETWATSLGPFWQYTTIDDPRSHFGTTHTYFPLHGDKYHIYHNVHIASLWNQYRQTRVVLNQMIKTMSLRLWTLENQAAPEYQRTVMQSTAVIKQMVVDICDSTPYNFTSGEVGFGGANRLMWPLFIAGNSTERGSATRAWILQTLDVIGRTTGIQQAVGMAQLLRKTTTLSMIPGM